MKDTAELRKQMLATGEHFNMTGRSLGNMSVTILEKVDSEDVLYRKERDTYHIRKFCE